MTSRGAYVRPILTGADFRDGRHEYGCLVAKSTFVEIVI